VTVVVSEIVTPFWHPAVETEDKQAGNYSLRNALDGSIKGAPARLWGAGSQMGGLNVP
jgi:hypothetical protein